MEKNERKELEQEYENLKLLAAFHDSYEIPENEILDRMNEIRKKLENE